MIAMIFAAGLGTRLKPFTAEHPKALVPVGGVPMLQRVILKLKEAGITRFVVNVHHFAGQIIDFLAANGNFGCDIAISDETDLLLDTGGGILKATGMLMPHAPVLVHNADILTDFSICEMLDRHNHTGADATLLVAERDTSRYLLFDKGGRMHGWLNKTTGSVRPVNLDTAALSPLAFGGVHLLSPSAFPMLRRYAIDNFPDQARRHTIPPFSITDFYIGSATTMHIHAFIPAKDYTWIDIGKPETLAQAETLV